jgi:hypothetical protein
LARRSISPVDFLSHFHLHYGAALLAKFGGVLLVLGSLPAMHALDSGKAMAEVLFLWMVFGGPGFILFLCSIAVQAGKLWGLIVGTFGGLVIMLLAFYWGSGIFTFIGCTVGLILILSLWSDPEQ